MIADLLSLVSSFIVNIISTLGYPGITVLMALESTCIPIPSEIIMPFSGYLVFLEKLSFFSVVLWGTIGNLIGSIIAYLAGFYGGRPLIKKYGRYIFISEGELAHAQDWFEKYGSVSVLFSRMLPVVRTRRRDAARRAAISLPMITSFLRSAPGFMKIAVRP